MYWNFTQSKITLIHLNLLYLGWSDELHKHLPNFAPSSLRIICYHHLLVRIWISLG